MIINLFFLKSSTHSTNNKRKKKHQSQIANKIKARQKFYDRKIKAMTNYPAGLWISILAMREKEFDAFEKEYENQENLALEKVKEIYVKTHITTIFSFIYDNSSYANREVDFDGIKIKFNEYGSARSEDLPWTEIQEKAIKYIDAISND